MRRSRTAGSASSDTPTTACPTRVPSRTSRACTCWAATQGTATSPATWPGRRLPTWWRVTPGRPCSALRVLADEVAQAVDLLLRIARVDRLHAAAVGRRQQRDRHHDDGGDGGEQCQEGAETAPACRTAGVRSVVPAITSRRSRQRRRRLLHTRRLRAAVLRARQCLGGGRVVHRPRGVVVGDREPLRGRRGLAARAGLDRLGHLERARVATGGVALEREAHGVVELRRNVGPIVRDRRDRVLLLLERELRERGVLV